MQIIHAQKPIPWARATIDYSGANEYVAAHYPYLIANPSETYFANDCKTGVGVLEEDIYDARNGVYSYCDITQKWIVSDASLSSCGFALVNDNQCHDRNSLAAPCANFTNWQDDSNQIKAYVTGLRQSIIPMVFEEPDLLECIFWNPVFRGEDLSMTTRSKDHTTSASTITTSSVAAMVHIDNDIGAYADEESVIDLILKNRVGGMYNDVDDDAGMKRDELVNLLRAGHRFVVLNKWRNVDDEPVQSAPLGMLATRYKAELMAFPDGALNEREGFWYCFPNMHQDEYLVFKQYDRDLMFPSDLWHCALSLLGNSGGRQEYLSVPPPSRRSFDVRAFLILNEKVHKNRDRFSATRRQPLLSHHESECFCEEQRRKRS